MTTKKKATDNDLLLSLKSVKTKDDLVAGFSQYFEERKETTKLLVKDEKWFKNFIKLNSNYISNIKEDKFDISNYKSLLETLLNQYNEKVGGL